MIIHHVIQATSMHIPYILIGLNVQMDFLISASGYVTEKRLQKRRKEIRKASRHLIFDSGILGFAKTGDWKWLHRHDEVARLGLEIDADRIASIDVPSEPQVLKMLGLTVEEARDLTTENAILALHDEQLEGRRIITVQGWTLDDRKQSLDQLMPLIEADPNAWIGNGSTCMLTPDTGLYIFYEWLCAELPHRHIHAWGIAQASWLVELHRYGVKSADSATAGIASAYGSRIDPITGKRIPIGVKKRDKVQHACDQLWNMRAMEQAFKHTNNLKADTKQLKLL